ASRQSKNQGSSDNESDTEGDSRYDALFSGRVAHVYVVAIPEYYSIDSPLFLRSIHLVALLTTSRRVSFAPPTALSTLPVSLSTTPSVSIFLSPIVLPAASFTVPFA